MPASQVPQILLYTILLLFPPLHFYGDSLSLGPLTSCWFSAIPFVCVSAREYILVFSSDCRIPLLKTHQRLLLLNFTFQLPKPIYNLVPTYHVHSLLCARTHYTLLRMSCSLFPDFFCFALLLINSFIWETQIVSTLQAPATCVPDPQLTTSKPDSAFSNSQHLAQYVAPAGTQLTVLKKQRGLLSSSVHLYF